VAVRQSFPAGRIRSLLLPSRTTWSPSDFVPPIISTAVSVTGCRPWETSGMRVRTAMPSLTMTTLFTSKPSWTSLTAALSARASR